MADFTQEQMVDALGNLTVMEMLELTRTLETLWGVSSAPVQVPGDRPQTLEVDAEQQTDFSVTLVSAGPNKLNVIKAVREITSLGLKEAKDLVEGAPMLIKENVSKDEATDLKTKLEAAGASVQVK